ncbi:uncharacterized protein BCR38DRAFT_330742 [Pseudomassariella vexata]|uniref:INO80 chromatin remodeling complex Ies1 n=1 Tax=Pseudomassariella vexata TaxID=1141098 RepID=A0A1Y2EKE2_9PEZI|nr:uncharacterized protein BCR38DRAFT_330742 [Pseudomassariella vexata]ORY72021.1 hypothetical protein BCR38DRAFT_330742 [Pseudomassariella vexata]
MVEGPSRPAKKGSRRSQANAAAAAAQFGTVGKIRHLKKDDGEPLWRKDIQYDFLRAVFDNDMKVFTNSYDHNPTEKQNFAELYIDTMARSSKTSKVLRDKLLSDHEAAKSMAMVCLLVNVGRMNTTLNFFPEMRAQLRTYHAIPSLQAHQDASAYKQLQDAPRLKSILKGAAEDRPSEPKTLNDFKDAAMPRTNPVNLIFLIAQQAPQVAELHFPIDGEFHDLIMKTNYTSHSRANAFLWLMWFYLESDFTEEGCEENPFGAGVDYGKDVANQGVPEMKLMTKEEEEAENIDTELELEFGREKQAHRAKIIAADQVFSQEQPTKRGSKARLLEDGPTAAILPRIRPSKHESDLDSTRSTPPPRAFGRLGANSTARRGGAPLKHQLFEASSPAGPSSHFDGIVPRKPRPPTAHQLAVERNRNQRVEYILDRGLRKEHRKARKLRRQEGAIIRARHRLDLMPDPLIDSDDEDHVPYAMQKQAALPFRDVGFGGLCPLTVEVDDFGEEFSSYSAAMRRAGRRLERWDLRGGPELGVIPATKKRSHRPVSPDETFDRGESGDLSDGGDNGVSGHRLNGDVNGDVAMDDADDLDDVSKELLGMVSGGEDAKDEDEELNDVEKALLGLDDEDSDGSAL